MRLGLLSGMATIRISIKADNRLRHFQILIKAELCALGSVTVREWTCLAESMAFT